MAKLTGKTAELQNEGIRLWENLDAILGEHLPTEMKERVRELVQDLESNVHYQAFLELAEVYRALVALMPENKAQIKAAYQATAFEADRNDEEDWQRFEREGA